jgi:hypothetical protein
MMRRLTFEEFEEEYRPIDRTDGSQDGRPSSYCRSVRDPLITHDREHLWTVVDVDGHRYILPGRHFVNREAYVFTEVPWETADIEVYDEDELECPRCGDVRFTEEWLTGEFGEGRCASCEDDDGTEADYVDSVG